MRWSRLVAALTCVLVVGCADYDVGLPHGFRLVRMNANEIGIVNPYGGFAVEPHIERYTVVGEDIVIGVASPHENFSSPRTRRTGYFVVDSQYQQCWVDLTEDEWRSVLRRLGVDSAPQLRAPSRFDWWSRTAGRRPASEAPEESSCQRTSPLEIRGVVQPTPRPLFVRDGETPAAEKTPPMCPPRRPDSH